MSIEKAMIPVSGETLVAEEFEIEIDIEGQIEEVVEDAMREAGKALPHGANLVLGIQDENYLTKIAHDLIATVEADLRSRQDWEHAYKDGLRLLGLKEERRSVPWENACGVIHPMITEAVIRFQANTIMEMFPLTGPCKAKVIGDTTEPLEDAARRLQLEFNHILTKGMPEYRTEVEQGLWRLGTAGMVFRKVWIDHFRSRVRAESIPAEDIIVPFGVSHLRSSPRYAHVLRLHKDDVDRHMASGWWFGADLPETTAEYTELAEEEARQQGISATMEYDPRYTIYEMATNLDLQGFEHEGPDGKPDGIELPYIVTVEKQSMRVLAIRRNWAEGDNGYNRLSNVVSYCYIPGWGFYGIGLLTLLAGVARAVTSILRQLVDAGTLANLPAGFKGKGFRTRNDSQPLRPGEFRDVEIFAGKISDHIFQMKLGEPSPTLAGLMEKLTEEGRRLGAIAELPTKVGEMPVGTIVAMIDHATKPQSAVAARVYAAFSEELDMIKAILVGARHEYTCPANKGHNFLADAALPVAIVPVADPGAASSAVRALQAQAAVELASRNPQMYDLPAVHRSMLRAMGVADADAMIPNTRDIPPADPIAENMAIMTGKPVRAGLEQDHNAHIQAHMAMIQDPRMAAIIGQSPNAQTIQSALASHLAEHGAFLHRAEVLRMLGFSLPMGPLPQEVEERLAPLIADAANRSADAGKAKAQEEQAQQQEQDPVVQLQRGDLALRQEKINRDFIIDMEKLKLEARKVGASIATDATKAQTERMKVGADVIERAITGAQGA